MVHFAVRWLTRVLYAYILKPILFRFHPDAVHNDLVALTCWVQQIPGLRALPRLWSHYDDRMLSQTIAGIEFRNPVGLSAGFDKKVVMPRMIQSVGFGWMTGGSVTWGQYKGNDGAWYYRLPKTKSLVVHAGLPSEGTQVVAERIAQYALSQFDRFPLIVSVAKTNTKGTVNEDEAVKDYCASLARFDKLHQVRALEINISCPNTFGGEPFTTRKRLAKLLRSVDDLKLTKPVFVKMPINLTLSDFDALLDEIVKHDVLAVTIGNLHKDRKAVELKDVLPDAVKGNLSGAPARDITTELVRHTYRRYGKRLVIVGTGGVFSAQDAYEKIRAGATLVGLITGMIFEGPNLIGAINYDLAKLLEKDGFHNVSEAVGVDS